MRPEVIQYMLRKISLLGIDITKAKKEEILEYIFNSLKNSSHKYYIVTPNPEIVMYARSHPDYNQILNGAEISIPDGTGITKAARILRNESIERIGGTDFMEQICRDAAYKPVSIGLLGARDGVAEKAAECLRVKYPGVNIVFAASEWPETLADLDRGIKIYDSRFKKEIAKFLNRESIFLNPAIDILFVAYGAPKQEEWIAENFEKLPVKIMMGVGGAFDYISGEVIRAPKIIRNMGFEWLYRLIKEPWRWKRQFALIRFIFLVFNYRLLRKVSP